jgi:hypothetical protein
VDRPGNLTGQRSAQEPPHRSKLVSDRLPRLASSPVYARALERMTVNPEVTPKRQNGGYLRIGHDTPGTRFREQMTGQEAGWQ